MPTDKQLVRGIGIGCLTLILIVLAFAAMVALSGVADTSEDPAGTEEPVRP